MPGVPSGRGCEACRRQKKKCDQAQPACSRCARLRIPCVGAGQQRYKFHNQTLSSSGSRAESSSVATMQASAARDGVVSLSPPSSSMTMTTSHLVSALGVLDPRFDLSVYGGFLRHIPRRLGSNDALDAAVDAIITGLPMLQSRQSSTEAFGKYTQALKALRVCLGDPAQVTSANTMCALYLIVICQGWMGNLEDAQPSHGEAIAHMLGAVQWSTRDYYFEEDLLKTLCVLVIIESYVNPRINIDPQLWGLPETFGPCSPTDAQSTMDSLTNRNLARITMLVRDPQTHLGEIEITYQRVREDTAKMARILATIPVIPAVDGRLTTPLPVQSRRLHVRFQTGYGILLLIGIMLNRILRVYGSSNAWSSLREESIGIVDCIITLAEQASQYRPMGSSASPLFLLAAYGALEEGEDQKADRIQALLIEYQSDFVLTRSVDLDKCMRARLRTLRPDPSPNNMEIEGQVSPAKADLCCIL